MAQAPIAEASATVRQAAEAAMAEHARRHRWRRLLAESDRVLGWLEEWASKGRKTIPPTSLDAILSTVERLEGAAKIPSSKSRLKVLEVMDRVYATQEEILRWCRYERARAHRRRNVRT